MKCFKLLTVFLLFTIFVPLLAHGLEKQTAPMTSFPEVADYIKKYNRLPDTYITKKDAKKRGWNPAKGNLWVVAPGKSIGGDIFQNREKKLPAQRGRIWYEADIHYKGGTRGKDRIIFSNDGLIFKTEDHYRTFTRIE